MPHRAAGKGHREQQEQEPSRHCSLTMGFKARQRDIAANAKNKGLLHCHAQKWLTRTDAAGVSPARGSR